MDQIDRNINGNFVTTRMARMHRGEITTIRRARLRRFRQRGIYGRLYTRFVPVQTAVGRIVFGRPLARQFTNGNTQIMGARLIDGFLWNF